MEVAAWREREAQARDLPRQRVLKDDALIEIAQQQPKNPEELGRLRALPKGFERSRAGEAIVAAVNAGLERDTKALPRVTREKPLSNGASATVELLKVLLRMTSERHGVAAKVIATVDDLERIAADDEPDVPALKGWRREMFGNEALRLKRGAVALAVEAGRVVAIDRERAN
jgi:ribonuclease D